MPIVPPQTFVCGHRPFSEAETRAGDHTIVGLQDSRHLLVTNSLGGSKRVVERFTYEGCFGPTATQVRSACLLRPSVPRCALLFHAYLRVPVCAYDCFALLLAR